MFRKYPYRAWPLLSLALWIAAAWHYQVQQGHLRPEQMAITISKDLKARQQTFRRLLQQPTALERMAAGKLTDRDMQLLVQQPYFLYLHEEDSLRFWNTSTILPDPDTTGMDTVARIVQQEGSIYYMRRVRPRFLRPGQQLTVLYPIARIYPFENEYLKSRFVAASDIPPTAMIIASPSPVRLAIRDLDDRVIGFLQVRPEEIAPHEPGLWVILLSVLGLAVLVAWFQLLAIRLVQHGNPLRASLLTFAAGIGIRALLYVFGLPFHLGSLPLFSPQLYASSAFLPSLGDLLLNGLLLLWFTVFIFIRLRYQNFLRRPVPMVLRLGGGLALALMLVGYAYGVIGVLGSVVRDSSISFDIGHFYAIDGQTIAGLVTIAVVTSAAGLGVYMLGVVLGNLTGSPWLKYGCVIAAGGLLALAGVAPGEQQLYSFFLGWLLCVLVLMDFRRLPVSGDPFSPPSLFWTILVSTSAALVLQYFMTVHERETRKKFAEQLMTQHDDAMEWSFGGISRSIRHDPAVYQFLQQPSPKERKEVDDHFNIMYLNNELNNYQAQIYLFDPSGKPLYNPDTVSMDGLRSRIAVSVPTAAADLYYREAGPDDHYYLAQIAVTDGAGRPAGHVFVDLVRKRSGSETVFPELLQPARINKTLREHGYHFAIYVDRQLVSQSNDYPFPFYLSPPKPRAQEYEWRTYSNYSTLHYRAEGRKAVTVSRDRDEWQEGLTLLSYLFGLQLILSLVVFFGRWTLEAILHPVSRKEALNLTLRKRIQLSMLGIVLISFVIIALVTITFFRERYEVNNRKQLQSLMQIVQQSIQQYLKEHGQPEPLPLHTAAVTNEFRYFITRLAQQQKTDINLFDAAGRLVVTSQHDIYTKGLQARIMRPDALQQFARSQRPFVSRQESIGRLTYISCYAPLRREDGATEGYINVPFFSSQKELDAQISNILIALINLYAFIFLISSVLALFATRWLTGALNIIIGQFERLNLHGNELLEWPFNDEIGMLVGEYNKMVRKVEESATLLAKSEREGAWREMARQVAHEIKNPLTPMKLNIQYLQQAIRNNHPKALELAGRVCESIIEQIDNLAYIASEFSNFAKMPEARPEQVDLRDLLAKTAELYRNEPDIDVVYRLPEDPVWVTADRSQLLRVFTNLLQNAVQAIPAAERRGHIEVTMALEEDTVLVVVRDNGTGISAADRERIFKPYFTTKSSGTGLGLAMSRKIIELWNGTIWFETEEGKGTRFLIRLPLTPPEERDHPESTATGLQ